LGEFAKFVVLGLGAGGAYALLALGIVQVYRGSGVVNFAQGSIGLVGAIGFYELRGSVGWAPAIVIGVLLSATLGVLIQTAIMRPLRNASSLMRVVATLAIVSVITEAATIKYGADPIFVSAFLPTNAVKLTSSVIVGEENLIILGIAVVLTAALWITYRKTRFGLASSALAENERATASLGWSPNGLAVGNWAAGGALAGLAGILLLPITGLSPAVLTLAVVPALAASLLGGFASFPLTLVGALLIGIAESETTNYVSTPGWEEAVPFIAISAILLIRGKGIPLRAQTTEKLPKLGTGRINWAGTVVAVVLAGLSLAIFTSNWDAAVMNAAVFGFISLSLVVVLGYAGQLSLAQYALAGVGAFIAGRLADSQGGDLPFILAALIGVLGTAAVGGLVALPAIRIRGVQLAVVTLGLAVIVSDVLLANPAYTGGVVRGTVDPPPSIGGFSLDPITHSSRYALFSIILFMLAALTIANLRRGRTGRRLIAVRNNERAAASVGVNVAGAKIYAFSLGAGLAAVGGILLAFQNTNVIFSQFDVLTSINSILIAVIGGIGYVTGALIGGVIAPNGPLQTSTADVVSSGNWYVLAAGLTTLLVLLLNRDGIAATMSRQLNSLRSKIPVATNRSRNWELASDLAPVLRVDPRGLSVRRLEVTFGGVRALEDVSLRVDPGEVVGLIGPNGAGKTTLIDAVTGFVAHYRGKVEVGGESVDRLTAAQRARGGLTRTFQSMELFEDLTVAENLCTASDSHDLLAYVLDLVAPGKARLSPRSALAAKEFALEPYLDRHPGELQNSGRRLLSIARAVAAAPSILLLDEPAAGLDEGSTRELASVIRRLADQWGMSILLVEHDVQVVMDVCDRIVVLESGRVLADGPPREIRIDPKVVKAYLGGFVEEQSADGFVGITTRLEGIESVQ
jgi:ABC-type branched-subunit amino acid transport system ATPase component/branched-subunit amino acid ABC-type transport system permease component